MVLKLVNLHKSKHTVVRGDYHCTVGEKWENSAINIISTFLHSFGTTHFVKIKNVTLVFVSLCSNIFGFLAYCLTDWLNAKESFGDTAVIFCRVDM